MTGRPLPPAAARFDVEIDDLVCRAGGRALLALPRLRIAPGERVAVVGPNGAGKSTLLRVLGGFHRPAQGRVRVLGREIGPAVGQAPGPALKAAELRRLRSEVGQVLQGLHLVPRLTARENVLIGALARVPGWRSWSRLYPAPLQREAEAALAAVGLAGRAGTRTDQLSGGERQKLSIARLRLQRPRLILADEPTANLDPAAAADACGWLTQAAAQATLLTVVHQPSLLPALAERVLGLAGGQLVFDLPLGDVTAAVLTGLYGSSECGAAARAENRPQPPATGHAGLPACAT